MELESINVNEILLVVKDINVAMPAHKYAHVKH